MDAKSLAKSKRAHSRHHSHKSNPVHKPKGNSAQPESQSALPSNWDRYDDDDELRSALQDASTTQPVVDAVLPKSKGGDYLHLISEAQAESLSKIQIGSDCLSSLDDLLHDEFSRAVGSMISARKEGILSWMEDDNFVVEEDDGSTSKFLSLDLNVLAKTLEKVEFHERLYIDVDLLPPELCPSQAKVMDAVCLEQVKVTPSTLVNLSEKSSATDADLDLLPDSFSTSSTTSNQNPTAQKSLAFETELDSLLDSNSGGPETSAKPANPSKQNLLHTTGFDDALDDLLESTSTSIKQQPKQASSSSAIAGKSKVLEEFDSWLDTI